MHLPHVTTRRRFLKVGASVATGAYLTSRFGLWPRLSSEVAGGTLPPKVIRKFVTPLRIPRAMPRTGSDATTDYYTIAVRQFAQQILPPPHRQTVVWGYGASADTGTFAYPAFTVEATAQ